MTDKKPNIHKTLLVLILVLTPPFWLLFTDEGARVSDTALLWLLGEEEIKVSLGDLDSGFTQQDIRTVYSDNDWQCGAQQTSFGDSLCASRIGTFNGLPSRLIMFYFRDGNVGAMKLLYREPYHEQLIGYLIGEFGQPSNVAEALEEGPDADDVLRWDLDRGALLIKKALTSADEPSLVWTAGRPGYGP